MSEHKVGTVATATVRGAEGVRVFWDGILWRHGGLRELSSPASEVTDVRPLVVLDLDAAPESIATWPQVVHHLRLSKTSQWLADQIEAQTKPPREPGSLAVVEATDPHNDRRGRFVHLGDKWFSESIEYGGYARCSLRWSELIKPVLVREGVA